MQHLDLSLAQAVLAGQPFSVLLGTTIDRFDSEGVELRLALRADLTQQYGFAHGGVLGYLVDNALAFAGGSVLGGPVVTSEYKINYLRPALGELLIAQASVLHAGRRQAVCECKVFCRSAGEDKLVAVAQGTIALAGRPVAPAEA